MLKLYIFARTSVRLDIEGPNHTTTVTLNNQPHVVKSDGVLDSKFHEANIGPTWVLSAPDGPHVCPMNLAVWGV